VGKKRTVALHRVIGAGLIFFSAIQVYAQINHEERDAVCELAEKIPNPQSDLQQDGTNAVEHCNVWNMYYGVGQPVDLRGARYCAYSNLGGEDSSEINVEAPAVLAMIYAGGKGVAANLQLAVKFACEIKEGWGDNSDLVKMLDAKQKEGVTRVDLDVCDAPTGREMGYGCLMRDQDRVADEATTAEKRFDGVGDSAQQAAFELLLQARQGLLYAHTAEEPTGTVGLAQESISEETDAQKMWARDLNYLADGKPPRYTEQEFAKADAALNVAYRDARATKCASDYCTTSEQVLQAERAWLAYREAWVSYANLRWPKVSPDSWRTLLTIERTKMLHEIE
jgi:uncharacterized protein YecT (DUF1311 family)